MKSKPIATNAKTGAVPNPIEQPVSQTPLDELQLYASNIKKDSADLLDQVEQLVERVVGMSTEAEAPAKNEVAQHSGIVHLTQHDLEGVRYDMSRIAGLLRNI